MSIKILTWDILALENPIFWVDRIGKYIVKSLRKCFRDLRAGSKYLFS